MLRVKMFDLVKIVSENLLVVNEGIISLYINLLRGLCCSG
jgi:hypothetical protein